MGVVLPVPRGPGKKIWDTLIFLEKQQLT